MKTKPFNLEEALAGAKVVTRSGEEVSQITLFESIERYCLVAVVGKSILSYTIEGIYWEGAEYKYDLFIAVETKKVYANVFEGNNGLFVAPQYFKDIETATAIGNQNKYETLDITYIKTIEITDEP